MNSVSQPSRSSPAARRLRLAALALLLGGAGLAYAATPASASKIEIKRDAAAVDRSKAEPSSYAPVVKRVAPSVVKITTETRASRVARTGPGQEFPGFDNPMFREFFGGRMPEMPRTPQGGLGSGVIISADGYIATNNHVVQGADRVTVALDDGRELSAKVVGRDPQTDIAVIKVEATGLPAITFADSGKTEVGDRAIAIGNPFGIGETVTTGIISAKGRRPGLGLAYEDFIQTDAAINPGNSGGALIDLDGRLIGINTAILSRSGGFQGVGLAVPSNLVANVADSLVKRGKVVRGFLGVTAQDITPGLAESLRVPAKAGALVADVQPGSPAEKAGLASGDIIVAVDGQKVEDANRLTFAVGAIAPGTEVELRILRDGKESTLKATTAERPRSARAGRFEEDPSDQTMPGGDEGVLTGVAVGDIDRDARRAMNLPPRLNGAMVTEVDPESAAARAGLRSGDVILEINRRPVADAEEVVRLSREAEGRKTLLKLWSRGSTVFVVVDETDEAPAN
ncbi:MAG: DegQ family serine endoprotease [Verrucomicrobia bacterium]|nr:DegQ family serine endoprotease [Verrucomicrobiota bacterium]